MHDTPASSRAELGYAELFIEVKPDVALDFFVDPSPETTHEDCNTHDFFTRFQNKELKLRAERVFGQHITYAMEIQARQHRVCLFLISMSGSRARILRWDRSGIIITQSFDILTHPELLGEFLARFAFASDHQRGHNMSIGMATQKEEVLFRDVVTKYIKDQLDLVDDALTDAVAKHYQQGCVFAVHMFVDDSSATPSSSTPVADRYLVFRPVTSPLRLLGRATRGYWAVQVNAERLVFLKDTWRPPQEREGTIIAELNAAGIRNVPQFVTQGDVYQPPSVVDDKHPGTSSDLCAMIL